MFATWLRVPKRAFSSPLFPILVVNVEAVAVPVSIWPMIRTLGDALLMVEAAPLISNETLGKDMRILNFPIIIVVGRLD